MINRPFIKLFKAASGFFLYDINTNRLLKIDKALYDVLLDVLKNGAEKISGYSDDIKKGLLTLEKEGYLKDNPILKIVSPYSDVFKSYLHGKMKSLTLEITQKCNFRCKYCDYSSDEFFNRNHSMKSMSEDMAKKAIDLYFMNSLYENEKSVAFYGGEPLLEFSLIKNCVEYIKSKFDVHHVIYHMTTNAVLLTEEIVRFLSENGFIVTISLDGPPNYHNKNRKAATDHSETFDLVYRKVKLIHELQETYPLKININAVWDGSVSKKEIESFFKKDPILRKYPFTITEMSSNDLNSYFAIEEDSVLIDRNAKIKKILTNYFQHNNNFERNEDNMYLVDKLKNNTLLPTEFHHAGMCIAGQKSLYVTVEGRLFPCEKFSTNCTFAQIGTIEEGFYYDKIHQLLNFGQITQDECKRCWAIRLCSACALKANGRDILSKEVKLSYCTQQKKQILEDLKNIVTLIAIDKTLSN